METTHSPWRVASWLLPHSIGDTRCGWGLGCLPWQRFNLRESKLRHSSHTPEHILPRINENSLGRTWYPTMSAPESRSIMQFYMDQSSKMHGLTLVKAAVTPRTRDAAGLTLPLGDVRMHPRFHASSEARLCTIGQRGIVHEDRDGPLKTEKPYRVRFDLSRSR